MYTNSSSLVHNWSTADREIALFAALAGIAITRVGYFTAFLSLGSAIFTLGAGLIYTLDIGSPASKYLGYQVILGLGQGIAIQIPVITGQAFSDPADITSMTAIVLCKLRNKRLISHDIVQLLITYIHSLPDDGRYRLCIKCAGCLFQ